jgi:hypothetical protein
MEKPMSQFHCSCGFAIDLADEFADHMHQVFARDNDMGTDGRIHHELADEDSTRLACACGFATGDRADFDDHLLIVFITSDGIGNDGVKHVLIDPSTPDRWSVREDFR